MNFFDAMKELEKGNKVRNTKWKDAIYLYEDNEDICFSDACVVKYLDNRDLNYGTWELYKEPILTKEEKEYLSNVIKPFKNKVSYIVKDKIIVGPRNAVFIQICVKSSISMYEYISLPTFISDCMYNNMQLGYRYSLKEVGLDD